MLAAFTRFLADIWFRFELSGIEKLPKTGPILVVSNHSALGFAEEVCVYSTWQQHDDPRRAVGLIHDIFVYIPFVQSYYEKLGAIRASRDNAKAAFKDDNLVIVFPGGDYDSCRPFTEVERCRFGDRRGYLTLAWETKVPLVPMAFRGSHLTYLFLPGGQRLAKLLGLKPVRLEAIPIPMFVIPLGATLILCGSGVIGWTWFVVGIALSLIPNPAKIRAVLGDPIYLHERFETFGEEEIELAHVEVTRFINATTRSLRMTKEKRSVGVLPKAGAAFIVASLLVGLYVVQPFVLRAEATQKHGWTDGKALMIHVNRLAEIPNGRHALNQQGTNATSAYIQETLRGYGYTPTLQPVVSEGFVDCENIIVTIPGEQTKRLVMGAHYDSYEALPGADDNASGVAVALEIAGAFTRNKMTPHYTLELAFYCFEEPPMFGTKKMGSHVHAASLDPNSVALMVSIEMVGYFSDDANSQQFPVPAMKWIYGSIGDFIAVISTPGHGMAVREVKSGLRAHANTIGVKSMIAPRQVRGIDYSDHLNFWLHDMPAVMVTDTSFYRNMNYHTPNDTPETLDYNRMQEVTNGLIEVALTY